jgi:hypothetical protein
VRKIFILLLIIPFCLISQSNNIELLDQWYIDGLPITNDGESVFNDVWGLEIENDKYAIIGSTNGTHILRISDNRLEEIDFRCWKVRRKSSRFIEIFMTTMVTCTQFVMKMLALFKLWI